MKVNMMAWSIQPENLTAWAHTQTKMVSSLISLAFKMLLNPNTTCLQENSFAKLLSLPLNPSMRGRNMTKSSTKNSQKSDSPLTKQLRMVRQNCRTEKQSIAMHLELSSRLAPCSLIRLKKETSTLDAVTNSMLLMKDSVSFMSNWLSHLRLRKVMRSRSPSTCTKTWLLSSISTTLKESQTKRDWTPKSFNLMVHRLPLKSRFHVKLLTLAIKVMAKSKKNRQLIKFTWNTRLFLSS